MRWVNIVAALSGIAALCMLVLAAHALRETMSAEALDRIKLGAFVQLVSATAGLAIANREGRLNGVAGAMILGGAAIFSLSLYALSLTGERSIAMLAPIGGITLILGWVALIFVKPR
ncbi:MAG: DUF423 domain-containing protein [Hyphomonadaceae bacterium]|nr:DUF423 domain-containing protein [Hyphomonadaceae bacterium]